MTADQIDHIELGVHPLVLELSGKKIPHASLKTKFGVYFAAAHAVVHGAAAIGDFSDQNARDPQIVALRDRVTAPLRTPVAEELYPLVARPKGLTQVRAMASTPS
jgi:2-methylcitrate dehydratase PrpD